MENLADNYKHIKGWGVDADPENEPTYPMKHWTGDDHNRGNYPKPAQQPLTVEILKSNERPAHSAVFGTAHPPSGLSGVLRRQAFKLSEGNWGHWLTLIMADRVNVIEGIIDDLKHGIVPNIYAEKGWNARWEHDKKSAVKLVAITVIAAAGVFALLSSSGKKKKKQHAYDLNM